MDTRRRNWIKQIGVVMASLGLGYPKLFAASNRGLSKSIPGVPAKQGIKNENNMKTGAFSVSLDVKDINASKQFYEHLGFKVFGGSLEQHYLIMKNEHALIGLFQGMFKGNILTFNPGWDDNAQKLENFDDIRKIQQQLKDKGIKLSSEADENSSGPASIMLQDPDGNAILFDQHV